MMTHCKSSLTSYSHVHQASITFVACTTQLPGGDPAGVHTSSVPVFPEKVCVNVPEADVV